MTEETTPPRVLSIAGSDSSGGAGIQADLKTFTALGVYGMAAITAVTAQSTVKVHGIHNVPPDFVAKQIDVVVEDMGVDAVKIGMLSSGPIAAAVAASLKRHALQNIVLDPVMLSTSGDALLGEGDRETLVKLLFPLAHLITPNRREAEILAGRKLENDKDIEEAAKKIHQLGVGSVLITGGHFEGDEATDILFDGQTVTPFARRRVPGGERHGTGCAFSAAIAAHLAKGLDLPSAISQAKDYVTTAIERPCALGSGASPLHHRCE